VAPLAHIRGTVSGPRRSGPVPINYSGSFFLALLIPGTGADDPPHPVGRIAGVPANALWAAVTTASAFAGWLLGMPE